MGYQLLHLLLVFNVFDHAVAKSVGEVVLTFLKIDTKCIVVQQAFAEWVSVVMCLHISATLQVSNSDFQSFIVFDFILYTYPLI